MAVCSETMEFNRANKRLRIGGWHIQTIALVMHAIYRDCVSPVSFSRLDTGHAEKGDFLLLAEINHSFHPWVTGRVCLCASRSYGRARGPSLKCSPTT